MSITQHIEHSTNQCQRTKLIVSRKITRLIDCNLQAICSFSVASEIKLQLLMVTVLFFFLLQAVGGRWRVTTGFCSCEVARPATGTVSSRAPPGRSVAYSSSGLSSSAPKNATECSSITTKPSCTIRIHPVLS
jgi:hypothetical protein